MSRMCFGIEVVKLRKLSEKTFLGIVTNFVIVGAILFVYVVSFLPSSSVPISGSGGIGAIYNGNAARPNVSLMFNVYWGTEEVGQILDILGEKGVKSTFFVGGSWADDNEQTLKRIVSEGHEIASHGYFHRDHKKLSEEKNEEEIVAAERVIEALSGVKPLLFAPPSGSYGDAMLKVCDRLGYKVIMWSKDTIDWRDKDSALVYKRATKDVKNGDLVLMHPMPHTVAVLGKILDYYKENGFMEVTVSENLL